MTWKSFRLLIITGVLCCAPLSLHAQTTIQNRGLLASPAINEIEADPGKTYDLDYKVENDTSSDNLNVDVSVETFQEGEIQGGANVVPFEADKDNSYWLKIDSKQVYKSGETKKLNYQLSIPQEAAPGAYFFAIVYQPKTAKTTSDNNALILKTRIATLLFVNIGGDVSKQPIISDYSVNASSSSSATIIDPIFDRLDLTYTVLVKGRSFYRPNGNLFLTDSNADSIITLSSVSSDRIILPGSKRDFQFCARSTFSLAKGCSTTETSDKLPLFGNKNLVLRFDYTDGNSNPQTLVAQKQVILFPYKTLLFVLGMSGVGYLIYFILHRFRLNHATKNQSTR